MGMQPDAISPPGPAPAVEPITQNGMTDPGEMNSNLMGSSGLELDLEERSSLDLTEHAEVRAGRPA